MPTYNYICQVFIPEIPEGDLPSLFLRHALSDRQLCCLLVIELDEIQVNEITRTKEESL